MSVFPSVALTLGMECLLYYKCAKFVVRKQIEAIYGSWEKSGEDPTLYCNRDHLVSRHLLQI